MLKKFYIIGLLALAVGILVSCGPTMYTVTFNDGTSTTEVQVEAGNAVSEPSADPVRTGYSFTGWYTDEDATNLYDFSQPVNSNMTLYAGWSTSIVVRFNTMTTATVPSVIGTGPVNKPTDPVREGFVFAGWYHGASGFTAFDPVAQVFPFTPTESVTLFAYWEPVDSKEITWSRGETFVTSLQTDAVMVLNPTVYTFSHEATFMEMMSTPLYSSEVDWEKAIEQGVADFVGDFSKIEAGEFFVDALDYVNILLGATTWPVDSDGNDHSIDGKFDRQNAAQFEDTVWTYNLSEDVFFEDGTQVNAYTYEYTLKQFLDPVQLNSRANLYYRDAANRNGLPINNADKYFAGDISWDEVGFEVINEFSFKVTYSVAISQTTSMSIGDMTLLHPETYEASLRNGRDSQYGTPAYPFVSYGGYLIRSWDENQKILFNKNFGYVAKHTINYKAYQVEIVASLQQAQSLFENGVLDTLSLTNDNYAQFAEDPSLRTSWEGYPQYIIVNTANSRNNTSTRHPILSDETFRQALLFGFDRNYYASNVYAPNASSLLPVPVETKAYLQDVQYYSQSNEHLQMLLQHGIDSSTAGYNPERAVELFNTAYNAWIAADASNSGPVVLKYIANNGTDLSVKMAEYVEASYEALFGTDKLDIQITWGDQTTISSLLSNYDFDLALTNIGFGVSYGIVWQYPSIAFIGSIIGAASLGLTQPVDDINGVPTVIFEAEKEDEEDYEINLAAYALAEVEVDLTVTYNYLTELAEGTTLTVLYQQMLDWLEEDGDKPAGILKVSVLDLALYLGEQVGLPFSGTTTEPFPGATTEVYKIVAALEDIFYTYAPLIPTVSRQSAVIYSSAVVILWPSFSTGFGWGANSYRYLNTDPMFANGLYNHFETLFNNQ